MQAGSLKKEYAEKICDFYGLGEPFNEGEHWLTSRQPNDNFPYTENPDSRGYVILNLWLINQILKEHPHFFD